MGGGAFFVPGARARAHRRDWRSRKGWLSVSSISDYLLERTSKVRPRRALLVLEDGTVFADTAAGASGEVFGEICFNTSLEGYLEKIGRAHV